MCALALLASCDWSTFDHLHDDASGVALVAPDGYPALEFGAVVAGYDGMLGSAHVSRVVVGAGTDAPIRVIPLWDGTQVDLTTPTYIACRNAGECEPGMGAAVTGIPAWRTDPLCTVFGGSMSGGFDVHCEGGASVTAVEHVPGPAGVGFGHALAGLPDGFPMGGFLAGAPMGNAGGGGLYRVTKDGVISELALGSATTGAVAVGTALAIAPLAGGDVLVAATGPGLSTSRVVVARLSTAGTVEVRACIDDTHAGAMGAVALGDLDGDGAPDLVVGDSGLAAGRRDSVQLYFGRDMSATPSCTGAWGAAATTIACPPGVRSLACGGSGFGAALAIGDVDADGEGDLIVGAPASVVNGVTGAGAVYLFRGTGSGVDTAGADALTDSTPKSDASLGRVVAVARSRGSRAEVIAGAPGTSEAIVFLCSGLPNDGPLVGPHCVPSS